MAITLKVSPDELKIKAEEIKGQIKNFESDWQQADRILQNSKRYWTGDAGNAHQKQFSQYKQDVERIIKRLYEHPTDLLQMAQIYEEGEQEAVETAQLLSGDVIS